MESRVGRGCAYLSGRNEGPELKHRGGQSTKINGACSNSPRNVWGGSARAVCDGGVSEWGPWSPVNGHCILLKSLVYHHLTPSRISLGVGEALPRLAVTAGQSCFSQCVSYPICEWRQWLKPSIRALPPRGPETLKLSACSHQAHNADPSSPVRLSAAPAL